MSVAIVESLDMVEVESEDIVDVESVTVADVEVVSVLVLEQAVASVISESRKNAVLAMSMIRLDKFIVFSLLIRL